MKPLYQIIAELAATVASEPTNASQAEWQDIWRGTLDNAIDELPHGSGFDVKAKLDRATGAKLVFIGSYHNMDSAGGYAGWSDFTVTARASLANGIEVTARGGGSAENNDYIAETYRDCLTAKHEPDKFRPDRDSWKAEDKPAEPLLDIASLLGAVRRVLDSGAAVATLAEPLAAADNAARYLGRNGV